MQDKNITELIKDAFELEKQEQYKDAIELLYQGLNIAPDNIEILAQIADLYRKLKNYEIAKEYALKAFNQNKNADFAQNVIIKIYSETNDIESFQDLLKNIDIKNCSDGLINTIFQTFINFNMYQQAIDLYNQISSTHLNNADNLYYFALCNYFTKNYEETKKYANLSLEISPNNTKVIILLANVAYKDKDYRKVKELLTKIADKYKTDHVFYLLGLVAIFEKKYQDAVEYFSTSVTLNPKHKEALYSLANAYYFLGWLDEALKTLAKAKVLAPNDIDILYLNAEIYFLQGKYEYAIELITSVLTLDNTNINAKLLKANIYVKKELYVLAKNTLQEILQLDADNINALKLYYQVCLNLNWQEQVLTTLEKILVIEPENIDYMCKLAHSFCDFGRWEDAKIVIKNIFNKTSDYEAAYELAIDIYFHLKDFDKACDIADKWLKINPNSDYAHYVLAKIFMEKDYAEGLKEILSALKLNPSKYEYYKLAGDICKTVNNYENAYQYYNEAFDIYHDKNLAFDVMNMAVLTDNESLVETTFTKIKNFAPHDINIMFLYADYLYKKENNKKALSILKTLYGALKDKDLKAIVKAKISELK